MSQEEKKNTTDLFWQGNEVEFNDYNELIEIIFHIAGTKEKKTITEMALKCSEEVGELAQAVLSYTKAPGSEYKQKTEKDVIEEIVDLFIIDLALASKMGVTFDDVKRLSKKKISKWVSVMDKK